jgi:HK97 family phage prohead protease
MKAERRFLQTEVRALGDGSPKIVGYAATFNQRSQDLGGFVEIIAPGAFDDCLAGNPDIVGLFNHNMDYVLGRTSSGTMSVAVDSTGLQYTIDPPDTQLARDLMTSMKRKDIRGSSFGFYCLDDTWDLDPATDGLVRTILKAAIFDCSVVTDPAYLSSDAAVRAQLPEYDTELRSMATERRQALQQGDKDALADCHWLVDAHELLTAAELN